MTTGLIRKTLFIFSLICVVAQPIHAGCGGAGGGVVSGMEVPLGSNDLASDSNYTEGKTPRDLYIKRYESMLNSSPNDVDVIKRLGILYHHQAALEMEGMPAKAVETLKKAQVLSPDDDETLAFLGSAMTMVARDSWNPATKLSLVKKGTKMIDRAIANAPKNILIRMARATNSLNLPGFLGREKLAMKDLHYIEKISDDPDADYGLPSEYGENDRLDVLANTFYKLGMIYKLNDNNQLANSYFKKATEVWPESRWAVGASKALKTQMR